MANDGPDREEWESVVAECVQRRQGDGPNSVRATLKLLATLLRRDQLPSSGRDYVAKVLEEVAEGRTILPSRPRPSKGLPMKVLADVEREMFKRGETRGSKEVYERIAHRRGLKLGSVQKSASIGRSALRETIARGIAAGDDRARLIKAVADALNLPVSVVERIAPEAHD